MTGTTIRPAAPLIPSQEYRPDGCCSQSRFVPMDRPAHHVASRIGLCEAQWLSASPGPRSWA
jgi:hypothetical protein